MGRRISITSAEAMETLATLEEVVVGLAQLGSMREESAILESEARICNFIEGKKLLPKLAKARRVLMESFVAQTDDSEKEVLRQVLSGIPDWDDD